MALTETTQIPLGFKAPHFSLTDTVTGKEMTLSDLQGNQGTVLMFICNHCPYVIHVREELIRIANDYQDKGFSFIAISANDIENYPDDAPDRMKSLAHELNFPFPYLYDETQEVAKAYRAACTPDFSVFDEELSCVYRGRLDGSTPGNNEPVTGKDLRACLDAMLEGDQIIKDQVPSMGCNIKWKEA